MDSTSGNEHDDEDIEINVGPEYDLSQVPEPKQSAFEDENQWPQDQHYFHEQSRKNSTKPQKQDQNLNNSFSHDNNMANLTPDMQNQLLQFQQNMQSNGMSSQGLDLSKSMAQYALLSRFSSNLPASVNQTPMFAQMQMNFQQMMQMNPMMANMMGPGMQNFMQNMGMPMPMGFNGNQNWNGNVMPFGNQNFNPMMNNGASFNQGQQYQNNFANGNFRNDRQGSFTRGRGGRKGRGRGGFWQQQEQYQQNTNFPTFNNANMPYPNQQGQASMNYSQAQYDNQAQDGYPANYDKESDQHADDDEFAPGGQDEVQEALGDSYKKKSEPPEESKVENVPAEHVKQADCQEEPSTTDLEQHTNEPPKQEPKEEYIPEAYREDLDFTSSVPLSAPSGPSAKDVPFRARGHGRFPSRGRGSYQGINGYPPRSPARPVSQHQNISPTLNQTPGVVGAPTGPRAMREKDLPPAKTLSRAESDVGFKIRGTASKPREEAPRSATPRSTYDEPGDRERDSSRRHSRYDKKDSSRYPTNHDQADDHVYDTERDRSRRKSKRDDNNDRDDEMQDAEYSHSRSDSHDRDTSRRNGHSRRDKDKTRDKYSSSSKHKSSSRKYEDEEEYHDNGTNTNDYGEETSNSRSKSSKKPSKHDDRDERRDRDHERAEKDKHRKRSRHDRDREDGYEDADEEESRRRSRKHKKEHTSSSRKDRDRERDRDRDRDRDRESHRDDTDIGMRITGRSHNSSHHTSEVATPTQQAPTPVPAADKDPHTLEREARNRERMLKEQQRRENAAKGSTGTMTGTLSGGRQKMVKYEDELEGGSMGRLKGGGEEYGGSGSGSKSRHRR